jgi:hypothetical protein
MSKRKEVSKMRERKKRQNIIPTTKQCQSNHHPPRHTTHKQSLKKLYTDRGRQTETEGDRPVNCMTKGQLKTSCNHLVKKNGIQCPKCNASLDGPLPVYK